MLVSEEEHIEKLEEEKARPIYSSEFLKNYITDNSIFKNISIVKGQLENNREESFNFLTNISNHIMECLTNREFIKKNLIAFGEEFEFNEDAFFIKVTGRNFENCTIETGNLVGTVTQKCGGFSRTLQINSRFGEKFLQYLIGYSEGFMELENWGGNSNDGFIYWLLVYLWKIKLKKAYSVGMPKVYLEKRDELSKLRGSINIQEYIKYTYEKGKYPCKYREYSYDNDISKIISLTFQKLMKNSKNFMLLNDCYQLKNTFLQATTTTNFDIRKIDKIKIDNPYHFKYKEVVKLSRMILKNECSDIFPEEKELNAFLFDISMLFEHYIRKVIIEAGLEIEEKNTNPSTIPTGVDGYYRKLYPDIILHNHMETHIFDVKYKRFDNRYGVKREDLFQIISYLSIYSKKYNIKSCGFIYPIKKGTKDKIMIKQKLEAFKNIDFYVFFIEVPESGENFFEEMEKSKSKFLEFIREI